MTQICHYYMYQYFFSCQTYEGGFAGFPGMEAHGGYTFCGIAALALLGSHDACDIKALLVCFLCI